MMAATNLDKFIEIEEMMQQAEGEMERYLRQLKARYHYMNVLRREYSQLSQGLMQIEEFLRKEIENFEDGVPDLEADEDVKAVKARALKKLDDYIEGLEEENFYHEYDEDIKQLLAVQDSLEGALDADILYQAWRFLKTKNINIEEIDVLLQLIKSYKEYNYADVIAYLIGRISRIRSEYVSRFVDFREACTSGDEIAHVIEQMIGELEDTGYYREAQLLSEVCPDTTEARGKRPDPEPLLRLLSPIKSSGLSYFQSHNRKSDSYELNAAFAKEVAYVRRALLEDREYIGTRNAFNRVNRAYRELSAYMYARFHQLGGTPNNYHGHEDRKKRKAP